ncbi:MAG: hypothetical protein M1150_04070 [Patescibacteria group bacterium]|nr:hypothetical protein [Patescibacteria group bacterium]
MPVGAQQPVVYDQVTPISDWGDAINRAINNTANTTVAYIPNLIAAIIIFVVGWFVAIILAGLARRILDAVSFNRAADRAEMDKFLNNAGIKLSPSESIAALVKWFVILVSFVAAINVLGLPAVSSVLNSILLYIPQVIAAILILAIGVIVAGFIAELVRGALASANVTGSNVIAGVSRWAIIIFAILAALNELNIARDIVNILFLGVVATLALGIGLAIGLGGKDLVARMLDAWYGSMKK